MKRKHRSGMSAIEVFVAASILLSAIGLLSTLSFRTRRVAHSAQQSSLALQELRNQLDALSMVSQSQLKKSIQELAISEAVQLSLPNARIEADSMDDQDGNRIKATIYWDLDQSTKSISLVAWRPESNELESSPIEAKKP